MKKIKFYARNSDADFLASPPKPANGYIPVWYKKIDKYINPQKTNTSVKACTPFLDAMVLGYTITTFCDIYIDKDDDGNVLARWSCSFPPVTSRDASVIMSIPKNPGFGYFHLAFELPYGVLLPKGYSYLVTQPLNQFDLNTFISSGVIDGDTAIQPGGIPFSVRDGFTGLLPAGTPIAQIIPFKRDNWLSSKIKPIFLDNAYMLPRLLFTGWYKKNIWKKKKFL